MASCSESSQDIIESRAPKTAGFDADNPSMVGSWKDCSQESPKPTCIMMSAEEMPWHRRVSDPRRLKSTELPTHVGLSGNYNHNVLRRMVQSICHDEDKLHCKVYGSTLYDDVDCLACVGFFETIERGVAGHVPDTPDNE